MSYSSNYDMSPKSVASSNSNESISSFSEWSPFSVPTLLPIDNINYHHNVNYIEFQYSYQESYKSNSIRPVSKSIPIPMSEHNWSSHINYFNMNERNTNFDQRYHHYNNNNQRILPKRSENIDLKPLIKKSEISKLNGGRNKMCSFCKSNNESEEVYTSHNLKDYTDKITCPILLNYSCPICGATGEKSHTMKYCPTQKRKNRMNMLNSLVKQ
jgi:hypothetical protein